MIQFRKIRKIFIFFLLLFLLPLGDATLSPGCAQDPSYGDMQSHSGTTCTAFDIEEPSPAAPWTRQVKQIFFKIR